MGVSANTGEFKTLVQRPIQVYTLIGSAVILFERERKVDFSFGAFLSDTNLYQHSDFKIQSSNIVTYDNMRIWNY